MIFLSYDDQMIVVTNDHNSCRLIDEDEEFVAFLKDDMAVEMIVLYCTIIT